MTIKDLIRGMAPPDNPYAHQYMLLFSSKTDIKKFSDLLNEHVMLANFGDERILTFYQEEADVLTDMFKLAKEHPELRDFFLKAYWSFMIRVDFTRAFKGMERLIQAGPLKLPRVPEATGFGGLFKREKKPKSPEEALMEMLLYEQGGMYG